MTKVGLFAIGFDTDWSQFDRLIDILKTYKKQSNNLITDMVQRF